MSVEATSWAWKARVGKSSSKLVLLSLADRCGADMTAWPSIETLSRDTELDRKTVIKAIQHLEEIGLIIDTGERKGSTGKVCVYKVIGVYDRHFDNSTKNGTVPKFPSNSTKNGTLNSTKNGTQNHPLNQSRTNQQKMVTFTQWIDDLNESGEDAIPADHSIFEKAQSIGITRDYLALAWYAFRRNYTNEASKSFKKKYAGSNGWRRVFVTAVMEDWLKLWQINGQTNEYYLTTKGKQLMQEMNNENV